MEYQGTDSETMSPYTRQRTHLSEDESSDANDYLVLQSRISQMFWEAGSKQVKDTFNIYSRMDIFQPYFNVEPRQVRNRLLQSLVPRKPSQMIVSVDMYGPSVIILTLVALLLFSMKASGYVVKDGTLIGTAMLSSFSSWLFISLSTWALCYMFSVDISSANIFSLVGYSLFSHCIIIFLTTVFHATNSHLLFYALMILLCVPSASRVSLYLCSKTREKVHKLILTVAVFALHLCYLCYFHFGFHVMVEEIDDLFGDNSVLHHAIS